MSKLPPATTRAGKPKSQKGATLAASAKFSAAIAAREAKREAQIVTVKLHEEFIPKMKWWQAQTRRWRTGITPSPCEDAMLEGGGEWDEATELRALLECLSEQHLADTIATAEQIAACTTKGKK